MPTVSLYTEIERIYFNTLKGGTKTLAVTSANSGEGASTIAMAIAQRCLLSGEKTLFVDLNASNPSLVGCLPVASSDNCNVSPVLAAMEDGSEVITGILAPKTQREILEIRRPGVLAGQIKAWSNSYDRIIIDAGCLRAKNIRYIPAEIVLSECDQTLLVAMAGMTKEAELETSAKIIEDAGGELAGVILNDKQNPSLFEEIGREIKRLKRLFPRFSTFLYNFLCRYQKVLSNNY